MDDLPAEIDQLKAALASRTITAQATGLLASQFHLSTNNAWTLLCEISNMTNRKLSHVARVLVDTHNDVAITGEDRQVALAMAGVLDIALARIRCALNHSVQSRS